MERKMRWEKVDVKAKGGGEVIVPGKRWGHTCTAVRGGRLLYLFGGYGKDNCRTNQVHVFHTLKKTWSQPAIKGFPPTPRDSHSCTNVGDNLFVFGGTDGTSPLKDLHILNTSSHTWIAPYVRGQVPEAREGHSAALVSKWLFIFGGCGNSAYNNNNNEVYYNDLYELNTETFVWECATTPGTPPSPRASHTCSSWKSKVIVMGGEDEHCNYLSDVHILDADTLIWSELRTSGQLLPPRAGHSTVSFGKNLFVFGGFANSQTLCNDLYMLDVDTGAWTKVITTADGPSARFYVAGDCLDPVKGGILVFIGGCNRSLESLDDMYYVYTGISRESEQRLEELSLRKNLKLKCQEQNLNSVQSHGNQPMTALNYGQPSRLNMLLNQSMPPSGKKTFHAIVTERISEGHNIKTVIDGIPLHGILFLNKPNTLYPTTHTSSRKRNADDIGIVASNGTHPNNIQESEVLRQYGMKEEDREELQGDGSGSHEHHMEDVALNTSSKSQVGSSSETLKFK